MRHIAYLVEEMIIQRDLLDRAVKRGTRHAVVVRLMQRARFRPRYGGGDVAELHSLALAEANAAGALGHLGAKIDAAVETHDKLLDDAVRAAREHRRQWAPGLYPAHCEALSALVPVANMPEPRTMEVGDPSPAEEAPRVWKPAKDTQKVFGFRSYNGFRSWLDQHDIPQRNPIGKNGKPQKQRREVDVLAVFRAVEADARIAKDPVRLNRIERYRSKLQIDKDLEQAACKALLGR